MATICEPIVRCRLCSQPLYFDHRCAVARMIVGKIDCRETLALICEDWTASHLIVHQAVPMKSLHAAWDLEKALARDRKYFEYGGDGVFDFNHGNGDWICTAGATNSDHIAAAFAVPLPHEQERAEYLAPYRMRG